MLTPVFLRTHGFALLLALSATLAHATDATLNDWQPCPDSLAAEDGQEPADKWDITVSPYAYHWHHNPEHKQVKLIAVDRHLKGGRFCGAAVFTNSFGQPSSYVYIGQQKNHLFGNPQLFTKLSVGLLYGYRGKTQNKIPLNHFGIAPVFIPSLGYAITPKDAAQVFLLGTAGVLFTYTRNF